MASVRLLGPSESSNAGAARLDALLLGVRDDVFELEEDVEDDDEEDALLLGVEVAVGLISLERVVEGSVGAGTSLVALGRPGAGTLSVVGAGALCVRVGVEVGVDDDGSGAGAHWSSGREPTPTPPALM